MIQVREIIAASADQARVIVPDLLARNARQAMSRPRLRAMFLARRLRPELSNAAIGRAFDGRHHTTVLEAERKVADRLAARDQGEQAAVSEVLARLGLDADLDAAVAAAQRRLVVTQLRRDLEARRDTLRRSLADIERQLARLTAGTAQ